MVKKTLLFMYLFCSIHYVKGQKLNNTSLTIEAGISGLYDTINVGFFLNVEPKLTSSENTTIGLRLGATINTQRIYNKNPLQYEIGKESDNGVISVIPTFDYYFNKTKLQPTIGAGFGVHVMANSIEVTPKSSSISQQSFKVNAIYQLGMLFRGAVRIGNVKIGAEYNFVPKKDIKTPNNQTIGTLNKSYLGFTLGYTFNK